MAVKNTSVLIRMSTKFYLAIESLIYAPCLATNPRSMLLRYDVLANLKSFYAVIYIESFYKEWVIFRFETHLNLGGCHSPEPKDPHNAV